MSFAASGSQLKTEADKAAAQVWDLIKLGGADSGTQQRIGDLIFRATARGGQLPSVEDVRRRLGLRRELDASETFGEAWAAWLAGRRKARDSYANTLEQHGRNWLLPVLKDVALDRLTGEHCAMVFERIDMFNEEIEAAREAERKPVLPDASVPRPSRCANRERPSAFYQVKAGQRQNWLTTGYVSLAVRGSRVKRADLPAFWVVWGGSGPGRAWCGAGPACPA